MRRLNKTVQGRHIDQTERRRRIRRLQNAVCIMLLLGLTWSVGYLSFIRPASGVVQGIFTVLNSIQGYMIFMLYCVRQPQVRKTWRSQFSCCLTDSMRNWTSQFSSSTGNTPSTVKTPATRGAGGAGGARARSPNARQNERLLSQSVNEEQSQNSLAGGFRPETIARSPPERLPRAAYDNDAMNDYW